MALIQTKQVNISAKGYNNSAYTMKLEVYLNSQNVTTNSSNLTYKVFMRTNNNSWGWSAFNSPRSYIYKDDVLISTSEIIKALPTNNSGVWVELQSFTEDAPHNENGTLSLNIGARFSANTNYGDWMPKDTSLETGVFSLPPINRISVLGEIANFNIDATINIPITKYVSSYTNRLRILIGSTLVKTINSITNGYNLTFTSAEKNTIQNNMSTPQATLTFELVTLDGSTTVGTDTKTAIVSSLSQPTLMSFNKTSTGYQAGVNGIVDPNKRDGLQTFGSLYVNGIESILCSSNNINPSSFGGSWELIDKEFTATNGAVAGGFTHNTTNITSSECHYVKAGHTIMINLAFNNKVVLNDTAVIIGTIQLSTLGITSIPVDDAIDAIHVIGYSDGGGKALFISILADGVVRVDDVVPSGNMAVDRWSFVTFTMTIPPSNMLDSACNKFYWKRTA